MYRLLPRWLYELLLKRYKVASIYEIRIRLNRPIKINYQGKYEAVYEGEFFNSPKVIASKELINYIVNVATKQSIYAYSDEIRHCYIQAENGIRIGICGTAVYEGGQLLTIKNISSLNIRIAHEVDGCSKSIIDLICFNGYVKNTLVVSPPGQGKTTLVRDIAKKLSDEKKINNILIVDERFEIAGDENSSIFVGENVDILSGAQKSFAFDEALKTMNPSVIVTDEISTEKDVLSVKQAINSGVKVIATAHSSGTIKLKEKAFFSSLLSEKYFERYVILSGKNGVGTIESVFDENFKVLFVPYLIWRFFVLFLLL